ncbi:hypothetical protein DPMN_028756 [Dreissena polymorpha]|uniref:Uncharacterized protein n=1 Tax=Dreissena polymorpha TaxID=45954 RepID=A0A9D4LXI1_DREPO|nr:hypothetical protein DPMN_028756 [Dreissena polymorpha]
MLTARNPQRKDENITEETQKSHSRQDGFSSIRSDDNTGASRDNNRKYSTKSNERMTRHLFASFKSNETMTHHFFASSKSDDSCSNSFNG